MARLRSRKFWLTFAVGVTLILAKQLGLEIDEATVYALVSMVTGYNVAQGYVDAKAQAPLILNPGHMEDLARAKAALASPYERIQPPTVPAPPKTPRPESSKTTTDEPTRQLVQQVKAAEQRIAAARK